MILAPSAPLRRRRQSTGVGAACLSTNKNRRYVLGNLEIIYTFGQQKVVASFKVQNERYSVQLVLAKHVCDLGSMSTHYLVQKKCPA